MATRRGSEAMAKLPACQRIHVMALARCGHAAGAVRRGSLMVLIRHGSCATRLFAVELQFALETLSGLKIAQC